ncbi:MAG: DUF429 domain-containing protein [Rubrobacteraceae bacterium]
MRIHGLDFTSAPSRRKPLIAVGCDFDGGTFRPDTTEEMTTFAAFEEFLRKPGPWVCGMDFPFGQPRSLAAALGWPESWAGYVGEVARIGKEAFEDAIRRDMATRPYGSKWRYRATDRRSGSSSAMMLFRVPVGKMFFQGAPRLLASAVSVEPCRPTGDNRVAVEAYPAVVARAFIGRKSYKRDGPDAPERRAARETLVSGLESPALRKKYGFGVALGGSWKKRFVRDPSADTLDSLLCAVQAAWAHTRRNEGWGVPEDCDREEGWILDPHLLDEDGSEANHTVRQ